MAGKHQLEKSKWKIGATIWNDCRATEEREDGMISAFARITQFTLFRCDNHYLVCILVLWCIRKRDTIGGVLSAFETFANLTLFEIC
jgi:hypothetical protein